MAINVNIRRQEDESGQIRVEIVSTNPDLKPRTIELVARRAVDGKIMIFDHVRPPSSLGSQHTFLMWTN